MSQFLNQFSKENYETRNQDEAQQDYKPQAPPSPELPGTEVTELLSSLSPEEDSSYSPPPPRKINSTYHSTVVDREYHKKRMIRIGIICATVLVLILALILAYFLANRVTVKNLHNATISEANVWALQNKITLETEHVFDYEVKENRVISQSVKAHTKISKGSVIKIKVSKGMDLEEKITIPDFTSMSLQQINQWKKNSYAVNASIKEVNHETIPKSAFIQMTFTKDTVTAENYCRKDSMLIEVSKGPEELKKDITVPDFTGKPKAEVLDWVQKNEIYADFAETGSQTVETGMVISQSIAPKEKISKRTPMTFTISRGKPIIVPNFRKIVMADASDAASGLAVTVKEVYHKSAAYGQFLSQSASAGTELFGEDAKVTVTYSVGQPYIDNLMGEAENSLPELFYKYKSKGANITYRKYYIDSYKPKGTIVEMSKYAQELQMTDSVDFYISKGNMQRPYSPNNNYENESESEE